MTKNVYLFSTSSHPNVISVNSLDITFLKPEIDFSKYDYFIITSKQACRALELYDEKILKPALCISKATAEAYENLGGKVLALGLGYGDNLSNEVTFLLLLYYWVRCQLSDITATPGHSCVLCFS